MLSNPLHALLVLPFALRTALAQSTACNNSPDLCSQNYNNITYLGAHDSPFVRDGSTSWSTSGNQFYNSTVQLQAGVRLLSAQVHHPNSSSTALHLCHTSCDLLDSGTLSDWLGEVKDFLDDNPNEVVTILLVNSDGASASNLGAQYEMAGLVDYSYVPASQDASNAWPTLQSLINNGTRLVNFVPSLDENAAAPYLMDEWTYIFENSYENSALTDFSCAADRPSSANGNTAQAVQGGMMPLMNHFLYEDQAFGIQAPDIGNITTTNSANNGTGSLGESARKCENEYGRRPTFILVDFFNVGPAIDTVDRLNGVTNSVGRRSVPNEVLTETSAAGLVPGLGYLTLGGMAVSIAYAFLS